MRLGVLVFTPTQKPLAGECVSDSCAPDSCAFSISSGTALRASHTHSCVYLSLRSGLLAGDASTGAPGRHRPSMLPELLLCTHRSAPWCCNSTLKRLRRATKAATMQWGGKGSSGAVLAESGNPPQEGWEVSAAAVCAAFLGSELIYTPI